SRSSRPGPTSPLTHTSEPTCSGSAHVSALAPYGRPWVALVGRPLTDARHSLLGNRRLRLPGHEPSRAVALVHIQCMVAQGPVSLPALGRGRGQIHRQHVEQCVAVVLYPSTATTRSKAAVQRRQPIAASGNVDRRSTGERAVRAGTSTFTSIAMPVFGIDVRRTPIILLPRPGLTSQT